MANKTLPHCKEAQPIEVTLEEKQRYGYCTCGLSEKSPFCDGSHKGTGYHSLKFSCIKPGQYWLCQCKQTKTPPFCDGSHNALAD